MHRILHVGESGLNTYQGSVRSSLEPHCHLHGLLMRKIREDKQEGPQTDPVRPLGLGNVGARSRPCYHISAIGNTMISSVYDGIDFNADYGPHLEARQGGAPPRLE